MDEEEVEFVDLRTTNHSASSVETLDTQSIAAMRGSKQPTNNISANLYTIQWNEEDETS